MQALAFKFFFFNTDLQYNPDKRSKYLNDFIKYCMFFFHNTKDNRDAIDLKLKFLLKKFVSQESSRSMKINMN